MYASQYCLPGDNSTTIFSATAEHAAYICKSVVLLLMVCFEDTGLALMVWGPLLPSPKIRTKVLEPEVFGDSTTTSNRLPSPKENENYIGPIPSTPYYNPNGMNPKDRNVYGMAHDEERK